MEALRIGLMTERCRAAWSRKDQAALEERRSTGGSFDLRARRRTPECSRKRLYRQLFNRTCRSSSGTQKIGFALLFARKRVK